MMRLEAVAALFPDLGEVEITRWVERGWVLPEPGIEGVWVFRQIDVARIRLVRDLQQDLGLAEDVLPMVLSLLDQLYDMRRTVKTIARALETQPPAVRSAVLAAFDVPQDVLRPPSGPA